MLVGRCDLCQVDYTEVRMTVLHGSNDRSLQAGISLTDGGDVHRVLLPEGDVSASDRFIVDEWGWFQIGADHERGAQLNGQKAICCKVKNVWRLPPHARRSDMESGQEIIMLSGRWLGTRGQVLRHEHGTTYSVKLNLGGTAQQTLNGINERHIGLVYRDDDPRNYETILPTPLRFYGGEFVSVRDPDPRAKTALVGYVEKGNLMTDGPYVVVWGTGKKRTVLPIQDVIRVWTDEERKSFIRRQVDD